MLESTTICFLADRHDLYDDRIYWKMAVPLVKRGFQVHYFLIGNTSKKGTTDQGVHFKMFKIKTFSSNRFWNFVLKRLNPYNNYGLLLRAANETTYINRIHGDSTNVATASNRPKLTIYYTVD